MLYTKHAETAAVSCGTYHASTVSTPLRWIFKKTRFKKLVTHVESHASAVSLLESGGQRDIKKRERGDIQLVQQVQLFASMLRPQVAAMLAHS